MHDGGVDFGQSALHFRRQRYLIVRDFLPRPVLNYLKVYYQVLRANGRLHKDEQCPLSLSIGGDAAFDAMLGWLNPDVSRLVGKDLAPTYSYTRIYAKDDVLERHSDRPACEISVTVSIEIPQGAEPSVIYLKPPDLPETRVEMLEGDGCIYAGTEVEHWRHPFTEDGYIQLFLHFIDKRGEHFPDWTYDKRKYLGTPYPQPGATRDKPVALAVPQALQRAFAAYKEGKLTQAAQVCQNILSVKPDTFDAQHLLAVVQASLGEKAAALNSFDRALQLRPDSAEALNNRGALLTELRRVEDALASYERALAVQPGFVEALNNRGHALRELKRFEGSLESYDRALSLGTGDARGYFSRGNVLAALNRHEEALANYEQALLLQPDWVNALYHRGLTLHMLGRLGEALQSYNRALSVQPEFVDALYNRGVTLHAMNRLVDAQASYDRALTWQPDHAGALNNRGIILKEMKRLDDALASCDRAIAAQPNFAEALNNRGLILHELGRFEEALASYERAVSLLPNFVSALNNRGITLHELKRYREALAIYDRVISLDPRHAEALNNRGVTLHELRRFEDAMASYRQALSLKPEYADALNGRGLALKELNRFDEALADFDRVLVLRPDDAKAHNNSGIVLHELQRLDDALASYDRALSLRPDYAAALVNRGVTLHLLKRSKEALQDFDRALSLQPGFVEALNNRAGVLHELNLFDEALETYDRALALAPDHVEALNSRGVALKELKRFDEALASFDRALGLRPDFAEALNNRAVVLQELKRYDEALETLNRALAARPDYAEVLNNIGNELRALGRFDESREAYARALKLDPKLVGSYFNSAEFEKFTPASPHLKAMETMRFGDGPMTDGERMRLDFVLAKAYADIKEYRASFERLLSGNALKRAQIQYNETAALAAFDNIKNVFTPELVRQKQALDGGQPSSVPIFIVGMPRSGTSLVEQILASHPQVHGAGELRNFNEAVQAMCRSSEPASSYPEMTLKLDANSIGAIGERYLASVRTLAPEARRITDKLPSNYYYAGLIHLALPNAKIIRVVRDPVDTCISCFSKLFSMEQNFSYDLVELGRYYRAYEALMAHWHQVLPAGSILDVSYEEVVRDLETQARRIVTHSGLEWDERCLAFHKTERAVRTASVVQVRQPIYETAVGRWHVYEEFLDPLLAELGLGKISQT
jgi:tetratricopeptide (TPR) repeat protein